MTEGFLLRKLISFYWHFKLHFTSFSSLLVTKEVRAESRPGERREMTD